MFPEAFERLCRKDPDALAVLQADTGEEWTRRDLARAAEECERRLAPEPDRVIGLHLPGGPGFLAELLAAWRLGRTVIPLDAELPPETARQVAEDLGAGLLIEEQGLRALSPRLAPASGFLIKVTSGSTGRPRGVELTSAALEAGVQQIVATMGLRAEDRTLVAIPLAHSYAFDNAVLTLFLLGSPIILVKDRTPARFARLFRESGATVWPAVPVFIDLLGRAPRVEPEAFRACRLVISAGAPLALGARERFAERFGVRPRNFFGSTECGGISFDREGTAGIAEGCVGTPLEGVSLSLEGANGDGIGRVRVHSASVGKGYLPDAAPDLDGSSFLTGDLARLDDAGRVHLVGRVGDMINVGARKVHPAEIESFLLGLPGVADAVVVAAERGSSSEALRAVVAGNGLRADALRQSCEAHLAAWKVPSRIEIRASLPRNARGKIDRNAL